ncbi:MAG: leucine-rich repeat protein, partial [Lachnospiraceae bacterium]|nr:leucine-rich repeat protein [Lachnospiraceae bacterium]
MFKRKIKQFICALLVVSLLLVNKGMYTGYEVHASTRTYENETDGFAEAVADYYKNGEIDTQRDFEVYPDGNYERSIVTDTYRENNGGVNRVKEYVAQSTCIWEKEAYPAGRIESCEYIGDGEGKIDGKLWKYDIIRLWVSSYPYPSYKANLYAVNVRPANSKIEEKNITLPAYIEATIGEKKEVLKCVELADAAFLQNEKITEVKIPDTYQRICAYAFTGCKNLEKIHFVTTNPEVCSEGEAIDAYTVDETVSGEQNLDNSDLHFL